MTEGGNKPTNNDISGFDAIRENDDNNNVAVMALLADAEDRHDDMKKMNKNNHSSISSKKSLRTSPPPPPSGPSQHQHQASSSGSDTNRSQQGDSLPTRMTQCGREGEIVNNLHDGGSGDAPVVVLAATTTTTGDAASTATTTTSATTTKTTRSTERRRPSAPSSASTQVSTSSPGAVAVAGIRRSQTSFSDDESSVDFSAIISPDIHATSPLYQDVEQQRNSRGGGVAAHRQQSSRRRGLRGNNNNDNEDPDNGQYDVPTSTPIEATLVDPEVERERIREEIRQEAPKAIVVVDNMAHHHDHTAAASAAETATHEKEARRKKAGYIRIVLLVEVVVIILLLVGLGLGLGLGLGVETKSTSTNVVMRNEECEHALPVSSLPFFYSVNTILADNDNITCPADDVKNGNAFASLWFHVSVVAPSSPNEQQEQEQQQQEGINTNTTRLLGPSDSVSLCIKATALGMDGLLVGINVYQGICNTLSCVLAPPTPAPTMAPTSMPTSSFINITTGTGDEEMTQPEFAKKQTQAPLYEDGEGNWGSGPEEPFIPEKTSKNEIIWPLSKQNGNSNFTLITSWYKSLVGNFTLNITTIDCP